MSRDPENGFGTDDELQVFCSEVTVYLCRVVLNVLKETPRYLTYCFSSFGVWSCLAMLLSHTMGLLHSLGFGSLKQECFLRLCSLEVLDVGISILH